MEIEKVLQDLNKRFAAPLPEFYQRRIIFWHDEDKEFVDQVDELCLDNAKLIKLNGSNSFAVKKLLAMDDITSNYLVYCPIGFERPEDNWLLNMELYSGEAFRADLYTLWLAEMGLGASHILRRHVKQYHKFFNSKERRGKIAAMSGGIATTAQFHLAIMAVVCGIKDMSPNSIIRAVLKGGLDAEINAVYQGIVKYGVQAPFRALISQATGYNNGDEEPQLAQVAAHILLTAASRSLPQEAFHGLENFLSVAHQSFCYDLVSEWLHASDWSELYDIARAIEKELMLPKRFSKLEIEELLDTECFPCINEVILSKLMTDIKDYITYEDAIAQAVEKRRTMAWYDALSSYYEGLLQVGRMQAFRREHAIGFHEATPQAIWEKYTSDYYYMDSYYRQFHRCFQRSLKFSNELLDDLFKHVAEKVEALYAGWYLNGLGSNWSDVAAEELEKHGFIQEVSRQTNFYRDNISCSDRRVFVIISDALRYEVAATLAEQLRRETQSKVELGSMCGIFPTITAYGMAALLPHQELTVVEKTKDRLAVLADGQSTESSNRDKVLKAANPASVALQYGNIIGLKRAERQELVKGMDVVYIYHDKIDEASHTSDAAVFSACDDAIDEIKNLVRIIVNEFGGTRILITADHGFLYTYSPLTEEDKVSKDSWQDKQVDYGRRYAIMEKGAQPEYLMPIRFLEGRAEYNVFAPRENIRIKMNGGGLNFVHGGISLQEMVVPLIDYHYLRSSNKEYQKNRDRIDTKPAEVSLLSSSKKISNMNFSLNFYQKEPLGPNREKAVYALYFTDSAGKAVSDTVRIIADKTSENTAERTFRCSFNLKSLTFDSRETYYLMLVDERSQQIPQREEFQIDIATAVDEFKFF